MANYSESFIEQVWEKANIIQGYDEKQWRQDFAGAWIHREQYGMQSNFGWEIDHLRPVSAGGTDDLANLVPLHWRNNETKGANTPTFNTSVSSEGNKNVNVMKSWQLS